MHDITADPAESWPCELCGRPSRARVHPGCRAHVDEGLAALPGLYRALAGVLAPGRRGGDGRTASRTAPMPVSEPVLDLRAWGGIEGVVTTWERDARETLGWEPPPFRGSVEQTIDGAVIFLRGNLAWFCDAHPAVGELAEDVRRLVGECERLITGERRERRVPVTCPCGTTMRVTISTPGEQCRGCGTQYTREAILDLPVTERRAA